MMTDQWFTIDNIHEVDTPALVFYPDHIRKNINLLKSFVPDLDRLRPHVKTHKSGEITRLLLGAGICKFKCATIAEAEMLALCGAPDVLLAYQPVGPKVTRLAQLVLHYPDTTFSCLVDNLAAAQALNDAMTAINHCLPVYLDLNLGMNRTGILPGANALDLYLKLKGMSGIIPAGLHAYDGHIRDQDIAERTSRCNTVFEPVMWLKNELLDDGEEEVCIIAGGSPTFPIHANRKEVECSPGTCILWDKGYHDLLPEQPFLYGALVVTRVVSHPADHTFCIDLGHKSIASENPINKRVHFLNAENAEPVGHSEEHMILTSKQDTIHVGDVLYGVPYHICPTVALHDTAYVVHERRITEEWPITSRTRKINY